MRYKLLWKSSIPAQSSISMGLKRVPAALGYFLLVKRCYMHTVRKGELMLVVQAQENIDDGVMGRRQREAKLLG
jgi:hypothetical protein